MNDLMKGITVALIVIALYLVVKGRQAKQIITQSGTIPPCTNPQNVINNLPLESSNCAIPIASDYLCAPHCHVPAVSPVTQRATRFLPIFRQPFATLPFSNASAGGVRMATAPPTCGVGMASGAMSCSNPNAALTSHDISGIGVLECELVYPSSCRSTTCV